MSSSSTPSARARTVLGAPYNRRDGTRGTTGAVATPSPLRAAASAATRSPNDAGSPSSTSSSSTASPGPQKSTNIDTWSPLAAPANRRLTARGGLKQPASSPASSQASQQGTAGAAPASRRVSFAPSAHVKQFNAAHTIAHGTMSPSSRRRRSLQSSSAVPSTATTTSGMSPLTRRGSGESGQSAAAYDESWGGDSSFEVGIGLTDDENDDESEDDHGLMNDGTDGSSRRRPRPPHGSHDDRENREGAAGEMDGSGPPEPKRGRLMLPSSSAGSAATDPDQGTAFSSGSGFYAGGFAIPNLSSAAPARKPTASWLFPATMATAVPAAAAPQPAADQPADPPAAAAQPVAADDYFADITTSTDATHSSYDMPISDGVGIVGETAAPFATASAMDETDADNVHSSDHQKDEYDLPVDLGLVSAPPSSDHVPLHGAPMYPDLTDDAAAVMPLPGSPPESLSSGAVRSTPTETARVAVAGGDALEAWMQTFADDDTDESGGRAMVMDVDPVVPLTHVSTVPLEQQQQQPMEEAPLLNEEQQQQQEEERPVSPTVTTIPASSGLHHAMLTPPPPTRVAVSPSPSQRRHLPAPSPKSPVPSVAATPPTHQVDASPLTKTTPMAAAVLATPTLAATAPAAAITPTTPPPAPATTAAQDAATPKLTQLSPTPTTRKPSAAGPSPARMASLEHAIRDLESATPSSSTPAEATPATPGRLSRGDLDDPFAARPKVAITPITGLERTSTRPHKDPASTTKPAAAAAPTTSTPKRNASTALAGTPLSSRVNRLIAVNGWKSDPTLDPSSPSRAVKAAAAAAAMSSPAASRRKDTAETLVLVPSSSFDGDGLPQRLTDLTATSRRLSGMSDLGVASDADVSDLLEMGIPEYIMDLDGDGTDNTTGRLGSSQQSAAAERQRRVSLGRTSFSRGILDGNDYATAKAEAADLMASMAATPEDMMDVGDADDEDQSPSQLSGVDPETGKITVASILAAAGLHFAPDAGTVPDHVLALPPPPDSPSHGRTSMDASTAAAAAAAVGSANSALLTAVVSHWPRLHVVHEMLRWGLEQTLAMAAAAADRKSAAGAHDPLAFRPVALAATSIMDRAGCPAVIGQWGTALAQITAGMPEGMVARDFLLDRLQATELYARRCALLDWASVWSSAVAAVLDDLAAIKDGLVEDDARLNDMLEMLGGSLERAREVVDRAVERERQIKLANEATDVELRRRISALQAQVAQKRQRLGALHHEESQRTIQIVGLEKEITGLSMDASHSEAVIADAAARKAAAQAQPTEADYLRMLRTSHLLSTITGWTVPSLRRSSTVPGHASAVTGWDLELEYRGILRVAVQIQYRGADEDEEWALVSTRADAARPTDVRIARSPNIRQLLQSMIGRVGDLVAEHRRHAASDGVTVGFMWMAARWDAFAAITALAMDVEVRRRARVHVDEDGDNDRVVIATTLRSSSPQTPTATGERRFSVDLILVLDPWTWCPGDPLEMRLHVAYGEAPADRILAAVNRAASSSDSTWVAMVDAATQVLVEANHQH